MSIQVSKIIYHNDNPDSYVEMSLDFETLRDFSYVAGKIESLFPRDFQNLPYKIRNVEESLFNSTGQTRILPRVTPNGLYYLRIRPTYKLDSIIVTPKEVVVDLYYSSGSLLYGFYNLSQDNFIEIRAKLVPDDDNSYARLQAKPDDNVFRHGLLQAAFANPKAITTINSKNDRSELMNVKEAAKYLRMSTSTLYKKIKSIKHIKLGKSVAFKKFDLDEFIENKRVPTNDQVESNAETIVATMRFKSIRNKA